MSITYITYYNHNVGLLRLILRYSSSVSLALIAFDRFTTLLPAAAAYVYAAIVSLIMLNVYGCMISLYNFILSAARTTWIYMGCARRRESQDPHSAAQSVRDLRTITRVYMCLCTVYMCLSVLKRFFYVIHIATRYMHRRHRVISPYHRDIAPSYWLYFQNPRARSSSRITYLICYNNNTSFSWHSIISRHARQTSSFI